MKTAWLGPQPVDCDICGGLIGRRPFVDGATKSGPWAVMCLHCHAAQRIGLGLGKGQRYEYDATLGHFVKVAG